MTGSIEEQTDSTGWTVDSDLKEDTRYFWRAKALDYYEESEWTDYGSFWVNSDNAIPTIPILISPPPDTFPVFDMMPTFQWSEAYDSDPYDSVVYKLSLATDGLFNFVYTKDSIPTNSFLYPDSLLFNEQYWWKIEAYDKADHHVYSEIDSFWTWTLGDMDHNHQLDISDLLLMVDYMFLPPGEAPAITPTLVGDLNGNCQIDISDLLLLVDYMFLVGAEPPGVGCESITPNNGNSHINIIPIVR